jgi:uncharacterized membrane protein
MRTFSLIMVLLVASGCGDRAPEATSPNPPAETGTQVGNFVVVETPPPAAPSPSSDAKGHPCQSQDGKSETQRLKAIGTEPFWAAEVDGRCVTYKTPEDQQGTRIWAHVDEAKQGIVWNGALNGREFQLTVKPAGPQGCSDGMSDKTYPLDAVLRVEGETRNGCAKPL